ASAEQERHDDERAALGDLGDDLGIAPQYLDGTRLWDWHAIGFGDRGPRRSGAGGIGERLIDRLAHGCAARKIGDDNPVSTALPINDGTVSHGHGIHPAFLAI